MRRLCNTVGASLKTMLIGFLIFNCYEVRNFLTVKRRSNKVVSKNKPQYNSKNFVTVAQWSL